jgi:hypothetical protein
MTRNIDYGDETVTVEIPTDTFDRLLDQRAFLVEKLDDVDDADNTDDVDHGEPTIADAIRWLSDAVDSRFKWSNYHKQVGRTRQRAFDAVADGDALDGDEAEAALGAVMNEPAVYVLYSSCAHSWQGERDEETGHTELDDAADPADLSLVVSTSGYIMRGGSVSSVEIVEDEEAVEAVAEMWDRSKRADQKAGSKEFDYFTE